MCSRLRLYSPIRSAFEADSDSDSDDDKDSGPVAPGLVAPERLSASTSLWSSEDKAKSSTVVDSFTHRVKDDLHTRRVNKLMKTQEGRITLGIAHGPRQPPKGRVTDEMRKWTPNGLSAWMGQGKGQNGQHSWKGNWVQLGWTGDPGMNDNWKGNWGHDNSKGNWQGTWGQGSNWKGQGNWKGQCYSWHYNDSYDGYLHPR